MRGQEETGSLKTEGETMVFRFPLSAQKVTGQGDGDQSVALHGEAMTKQKREV